MARQEWEYHEAVGVAEAMTIEQMNVLGRQGWQLVDTIEVGHPGGNMFVGPPCFRFIFKRQADK